MLDRTINSKDIFHTFTTSQRTMQEIADWYQIPVSWVETAIELEKTRHDSLVANRINDYIETTQRPAQMRAIARSMGSYSLRQYAKIIEVSHTQLRRYLTGELQLPDDLRMRITKHTRSDFFFEEDMRMRHTLTEVMAVRDAKQAQKLADLEALEEKKRLDAKYGNSPWDNYKAPEIDDLV